MRQNARKKTIRSQRLGHPVVFLFLFKIWNEIYIWKSKQPKTAEPSWPICKLEDRLARRLPWWTCVFGQFPHLIQDKNGLVFLYASSSFINQMKRNLKEKKTLEKIE